MKILGIVLEFLGKLVALAGRIAVRGGEFLQILAHRLRYRNALSGWNFLRSTLNRVHVKIRNRFQHSDRSECPCCGWKGYDFLPLDGSSFWIPRNICPNCLAHDRHRALQIYITRHDQEALNAEGVLLNYAPEPMVHNLFAPNRKLSYAATDLMPEKLLQFRGRAFRSDILHVPLRDNTASVAFCLHLIEHLPDDRPPLAELRRVLKPGGILYVMVPIDLRLTVSEHFGRPHPEIFDHYWSHAPDFINRFTEFDAKAINPRDYLSKAEQFRYAIEDCEIIFRAVKR